MKGTIALLISGLAAQQVAATWNRQASGYNTPQYNNNECSDKQNKGFDWTDLKDGQKDFDYGDFKFGGGWTCANKFGKRDHVTKRSFNSKCVKNTVTKQKPASFSCDKKKDGFSVKEIDVSVDHDADLEFHYKMGDGSTCKQTQSCKKSGTTVKNTQCGGAKSVEVHFKGSSGKEKKDSCEIGFHKIDFDCTPGKTYTPVPPLPPKTSSAPPKSSPSTLSTATKPATSSKPEESKPATSSKPESTKPATSSKPEDKPASSTPAGTTSSATKPASSAPATSSKPEESKPATSSKPETSKPSPSAPVYPPLSCPEVLPKCLNTWIEINSKCKDNTDSACYCKIPDFTKNVIDCVAARATPEDASKALQYFVGICAADVPKNPGIITNCPSDIPINVAPPTPAPATSTKPAPSAPASSAPAPSAPAPSAPAPSAPAPSAPAPSIPCTTITIGTTSYTVPQIIFTTTTPAVPAPGAPAPTPGYEPIAIVPVASKPADTPAQTTPVAPYPIPSGIVSSVKPSGTGAVGTGAVVPTAPVSFPGAASSLRFEIPAAMGALLAFFAL
ncbi:hypothetical protein DM02DRAFT_613660 [Periconia macrospinosa]|uniref:CFEM domain-containing protein n=1 Tax=Periconia macrospinosa TaxID=97972 RepID=A0A2V1DTI4_9PLEO|nr:hypothetical protein DM02DRAFT_613660 [Periconia macrospinosa]